MKNRILTAKQSGDARDFLGLSQRKVATDARVNRNMLNLFERQRAVPDDSFLQKLRDYYELNGMVFVDADVTAEPVTKSKADVVEPSSDEDTVTPVSPDLYIRDGYIVAGGIDHDDAELILEELSELDELIHTLLEKPVKYDMFGRTYSECDECQEQLQVAMARAYCLVRQLHGLDMVDPCPTDEVKEKAENQGGLLSQIFTLNGALDDEDGQSDAA